MNPQAVPDSIMVQAMQEFPMEIAFLDAVSMKHFGVLPLSGSVVVPGQDDKEAGIELEIL